MTHDKHFNLYPLALPPLMLSFCFYGSYTRLCFVTHLTDLLCFLGQTASNFIIQNHNREYFAWSRQWLIKLQYYRQYFLWLFDDCCQTIIVCCCCLLLLKLSEALSSETVMLSSMLQTFTISADYWVEFRSHRCQTSLPLHTFQSSNKVSHVKTMHLHICVNY